VTFNKMLPAANVEGSEGTGGIDSLSGGTGSCIDMEFWVYPI